jgi:hypothetical protein
MAQSCGICIEPFNKSSRKSIICMYCEHVVCFQCVKNYLVVHDGSTISEPHCMSCKQMWDIEFLSTTTNKVFIGQLQNKQKEELFQSEKNKLPQTQPLAIYDKWIDEHVVPEKIKLFEDYRQHNSFMNTSYADLDRKRETVHKLSYKIETLNILDGFRNQSQRTQYEEDQHVLLNEAKITMKLEKLVLKVMNGEIREKKQENLLKKRAYDHSSHKISLWKLRHTLPVADGIVEDAVIIPKSRVICACPCDNECRGFVMSNTWACGACDGKVCNLCNHPSHNGTPCDPNEVETAEMLKRDCKPCPTCASPIYKISGCDQMWCVSCKTAFSWRSGKIDTGMVHNPHFFTWFREHGRIADGGDGHHNCDGLPQQTIFLTHIRIAFRSDIDLMVRLEFFYRLTGHIVFELDTTYRVLTPDNIEESRVPLRIDFLRNKITEAKWKMILYKRDKAVRVNLRKRQVLDMFMTIASDLFHKILHCNESINCHLIVKEFNELIEYTNKCFLNIAPIYESSMPQIIEYTRVVYNFTTYRREAEPDFRLIPSTGQLVSTGFIKKLTAEKKKKMVS